MSNLKRKIAKVSIIVFLVIISGVSLLLGYVKFWLPDVGDAPDIKIVATKERIEHGHYLAQSVAGCMDCHSTRDWTKFSGPVVPGTEGMGGQLFGPEFGLPGKFYAKNITPYALSSWTDGEIYRAMTSGVSKDGHALFPMMPYHVFGSIDEEDVKDIIAYLRTMPAVKNDVPKSEADFPMNFIMNTIPKKPNFMKRPMEDDQVAWGKYLVFSASCTDCHTQSKEGVPVEGMYLAGGMPIELPFGTLRPANLTPDPQTGLGNWSREQFIRKFKQYTDSNYHVPTVDSGAFNTIMPWTLYATMKESDLAAIYAYLQTLPAVKNDFVRFTPRTAVAKK